MIAEAMQVVGHCSEAKRCVSPAVKVARPELSRVRRSTGCPVLALLLPAVLVLRIKLPPV